MLKNFNYLLLIVFLFLLQGGRLGAVNLDDVIEGYRKTLPSRPPLGGSQEETALNATHFIFQFLGEKEGQKIQRALETIDIYRSIDSCQESMFFHTFYGGLRMKTEQEKRVGAIYQSVLQAMHHNFPLVGYLYGSAFKSASLFDPKSNKGKVLSRDVDLQERLEYETYAHLQQGLRALGLLFHFVVIRDDFHTLSLSLGNAGEKIYDGAPEIEQYGNKIKQISQETGIALLSLEELKNPFGIDLRSFIKRNQEDVFRNSSSLKSQDVSGLKGFLRREYEDEPVSSKQKEIRALERAKRYIALKAFVKSVEASFLIESFMNRFGRESTLIPFSIHAEDYFETCHKIPLRPLSFFIGGCNPQHQLPLLQRTPKGPYKFYTLRSDSTDKIFPKKTPIRIEKIGTYDTIFYEGELTLQNCQSALEKPGFAEASSMHEQLPSQAHIAHTLPLVSGSAELSHQPPS